MLLISHNMMNIPETFYVFMILLLNSKYLNSSLLQMLEQYWAD